MKQKVLSPSPDWVLGCHCCRRETSSELSRVAFSARLRPEVEPISRAHTRCEIRDSFKRAKLRYLCQSSPFSTSSKRFSKPEVYQKKKKSGLLNVLKVRKKIKGKSVQEAKCAVKREKIILCSKAKIVHFLITPSEGKQSSVKNRAKKSSQSAHVNVKSFVRERKSSASS